MPDLADQLGDFGYPAYQAIGNRVYLYGQIEFIAADDSASGDATILQGLPAEIRPQTATAVKLFTNTVSSRSGLWGPGYWGAVVSGASMLIHDLVDLPLSFPSSAEGVVLVLEGLEWVRSTGTELPTTEELLLTSFLTPDFAPGSPEPKLIRRGRHVSAEGVVICLSDGAQDIVDAGSIPAEWTPTDFTRGLIGEHISGSEPTHWYGVADVFGGFTINNAVSFGQVWHWYSDLNTDLRLVDFQAPGAGAGFYGGDVFIPVGSEVPDYPADESLLQKDRYFWTADFNLDDIEGANPSGVFFNVQGDSGFAVEYEAQTLTTYRLRTYVFNSTTQTLIAQRQNILKPGLFEDQAEVLRLSLSVWWQWIDDGDHGLGRTVFIELANTNSLSVQTIQHDTTDTPPAVPGPGGLIGGIGARPIKSVSSYRLFNSELALGAPQVSDQLQLHSGWNGEGDAPVEPGFIEEGPHRRGVVIRPQTGTPI